MSIFTSEKQKSKAEIHNFPHTANPCSSEKSNKDCRVVVEAFHLFELGVAIFRKCTS